MTDRNDERFFSPDRLKALTDGVIAIVITLLVLELSIPVIRELEHSEGLWPEVRELWREYLAYILSFFIVGLLWLYHHNVFRHIRAADGRLLLLNMFYLLAVTIMPFSSALVAKNWDERLSAIIYGASLFLAAAALAATFAYASWHRRLVDEDMTDGCAGSRHPVGDHQRRLHLHRPRRRGGLLLDDHRFQPGGNLGEAACMSEATELPITNGDGGFRRFAGR